MTDARATVTVASSIHTSVRLAPDHPDGRKVVLAGNATTEGVDKEALDAWLDAHKGAETAAQVSVVTAAAEAPKTEG